MLLAIAASSAGATTYLFSQGGYSGGGTITGSFEGADVNRDGQIALFTLGEITGFSLSFSGDSLVGSFQHGLGDLAGFVYNTGSSFIGDDPAGPGQSEGVATNWHGASGFEYFSGLGPNGVRQIPGLGGTVTDQITLASSSSPQAISVAAVPEPKPYALLLAGLGLLGFTAARGNLRRPERL